MNVRIDTVEQIADFERCLDLQRQIWRMPDDMIVPVNTLVAVADAGGLVLGAWSSQKMVGFLFGFLGRGHGGRALHHSHMTAVLPDYQGRGIGLALKMEQARRVAAQGIDLITWTFDPLEAGNAHFNLNRLGATANVYHVNRYGAMTDGLNQGLESDRLEVAWQLHSPRFPVRRRADLPDPLATLEPQTVPARWTGELPQPPEPPPTGVQAPALIEIPPDFQQLKRRHPALARHWRHTLRQILQNAFANGLSATDLIRQSAPTDFSVPRRTYYLLQQKRPLESDL